MGREKWRMIKVNQPWNVQIGPGIILNSTWLWKSFRLLFGKKLLWTQSYLKIKLFE